MFPISFYNELMMNDEGKIQNKLLRIVLSCIILTALIPLNFDTAIAKTTTLENNDVNTNVLNNNEIVVKFKDDLNVSSVIGILNECSSDIEKTQNSTKKISDELFCVKVEDGKPLNQALNNLNSDSRVEYAEPNYLCELADVDSNTQILNVNDPEVDQQWYINDSDLRVSEAWDSKKCNGEVTVAVIDSGIDVDHPDLVNNIISGYSFVDNNSDFDDRFGHGTRVAGIISAQSNNSVGISGVSYNAKILPIKVTNEHSVDVAKVVSGIEWAILNKDKYNVKVINLSLGTTEDSQILRDAVNHAWDSGILCVCSSGNGGLSSGCYLPASMDTALSVGSINSNHVKSLFSTGGDDLDVVAPGDEIYSTVIGGYYESGDNSSGTSFSAPFVSGVAALCYAAKPSATPEEIKMCITLSAKDLGTKGKDVYYGYGMVVASEAIKKTNENFIHRLYNRYTGEHFYTSSSEEKNALVKVGWSYENVGWCAPKSSSKPVYRLYNPNSGDHHYTIDEEEYNKLEKIGWEQEGVCWYSADDNEKNKTSILRQYNQNAIVGSHNFTQNSNEKATLVSIGWVDEGIAWWGLS